MPRLGALHRPHAQPQEPAFPAEPQSKDGGAEAGEAADAAHSPGQAMLDLWQREKEVILDRFTLTGKIKLAAVRTSPHAACRGVVH